MHAFEHFIKYDLDSLFVVTHAPGQSAYNIVERRMAPLSRDLAALILPHDHFGSHLDKSLKCIDTNLEKANFERAGQVLASVWGKSIIDKEPVIAEYIDPDHKYLSPSSITENWKSIHVRSSQYLLQVVKCNNSKCCKPFRSTINTFMKTRFLPSPIMYVNKPTGIRPANENETESAHFGSLLLRGFMGDILPETKFKIFPFDFYCPSVQLSIKNRICNKCGIFHSSAKSLKSHRQFCCQLIHEPIVDDSDSGEETELDESWQQKESEELSDVLVLPLQQMIAPLFEPDE